MATLSKAELLKNKFPKNEKILNIIGSVYFRLGDTNNASKHFKSILALNPDYLHAIINLGTIYSNTEKKELALKYFSMASKKDPTNKKYLRAFFKNFQITIFTKYDQDLADHAIKLLDTPNLLRPIQLSYSVFSLLREHPKLKYILNNIEKLNEESFIEETIEEIKYISLLVKYMELAPVTDILFEIILSKLRSFIIKEQLSKKPKDLDFIVTLSIQCFINEYVFYESENDTNNVLELEKKVEEKYK